MLISLGTIAVIVTKVHCTLLYARRADNQKSDVKYYYYYYLVTIRDDGDDDDVVLYVFFNISGWRKGDNERLWKDFDPSWIRTRDLVMCWSDALTTRPFRRFYSWEQSLFGKEDPAFRRGLVSASHKRYLPCYKWRTLSSIFSPTLCTNSLYIISLSYQWPNNVTHW